MTLNVGMTPRTANISSVHPGVLRISYVIGSVILSVITTSVTMIPEHASVQPNALMKLEMEKSVTRVVIHMSATGMIINV